MLFRSASFVMLATVTTTKTKTMTMTMMIFAAFALFVSLLAGANALETPVPEALSEELNNLLEVLATIASHVQPVLPAPVLAAAILLPFYLSVPARLAAAWGRLVRWLEPGASDKEGWRWVVTSFVVLVDRILSIFHLEDWQARALAAESENARLRTETARLRAERDTARRHAQDRDDAARLVDTAARLTNTNAQLTNTNAQRDVEAAEQSRDAETKRADAAEEKLAKHCAEVARAVTTMKRATTVITDELARRNNARNP